ncbi:prolyl oligopeptidase family serine peptidase [Leptobacterium flavescens]|uniref:Prolyl oligopeptidase family serine peptidase n=1 Tax=Leptobacterium flavescens TaxID=472055 RepID=A0A6P0UMA7_9FLAO|nr:alpha/beta fold hydrolase [Leptobacterium flavescens]NER13580.1 prolyl oligopeptidase family serine peptidase [Leptobacterium flavescens]
MKRIKRIFTSRLFLIPFVLILAVTVFMKIRIAYDAKPEYVSFKSKDITLKGIILKPEGPGPHPAILILHGSGGSYQTYDKWYNRFHANELLSRGFAVMSYTKRGSGKHDIDYKYVTYEDLMEDALTAVDFLRRQPGIDPDHIGLLGVSESGWFTPEMASKRNCIKFIINRVGPPFSMNETTLFEVRNDALAEGLTEKEIEDELIPLVKRIRQFYIDVAQDPSMANGPERDAINARYKEVRERKGFREFFGPQLQEYDPDLYAVRAAKYSYDPQPFLEEIDIPMLYLYGGKDINVPTEASVKYLERLRAEMGKDITFRVFPDAGHYMYRWKAFPVEGFYQKGYLDLIGDWAEMQLK